MTIGVDSPGPAAGGQPEPDPFRRIAGVLVTPVRTFAEIVRRPDVLVPLVLILVISYASTFAVVPRLDLDALFAKQAATMKQRNPNLSEDDVERLGNVGRTMAKLGMYVSPVISTIMFLLLAGVLQLSFRLWGGEGTYKQALSVTVYAWVPMVIFTIVSTVVIVARGSFDPAQMATVVKSNPAFLADPDTQPVLYALLASFDLFTIWTVVLLVIGCAAMSTFTIRRSAAVVVSLWVVMIVVRLGLASLQTLGAGGS